MKRFIVRVIIMLLMAGSFFIFETNSYLSDTETSINNTLQAACWNTPDAPSRITPVSEFANLTNVSFSWTAVTNHCPEPQIFYRFQIANNLDFTGNLIESSWFTATTFNLTGIATGEYYWRVLAKDEFGYQSSSPPYHLVIDTSPPPEASLSITGSYTKTVEEKIFNGGFESGNQSNWTTSGDVTVTASDTITNTDTGTDLIITPQTGNYMAKIGGNNDPGNFVWENRMMQSFDQGAKSMSVNYNFFSRDTSGYDDPGFFVRLNGQEIFKLNTLSVNPNDEFDGFARYTGWQQFSYDLSNQTASKLNLILYAGNNVDNVAPSWVYLDSITTYYVTAPSHAVYTISGDDNMGGSGIAYYRYSIDGGFWTDYSNPFGGSDSLLGNNGNHTIRYYSVDKSGNSGPIKTASVMTDVTPPADISDLSVFSVSANSVVLNWTAPGNDGFSGKASRYDIRYSTIPITDDATFSTAMKANYASSPKSAGQTEELEIYGLDPATLYYFSVKSADEAPNWSGFSYVSATTNSLIPGTRVTPGDIVINEILWMGTSTSVSDKFLELRNMTDRSIDLFGFKLYGYNGTEMVDLNIDFTGKNITPNGYFLITSMDPSGSESHLNIIPDIINNNLVLYTSELQIELDDDLGNILDTAWNYTSPTEGLLDTVAGNQKYYSMERTSIPGDGTDPLNWYTCIDADSTSAYFDGGADERGTPGAINRSENEPLSHQKLFTSRPITVIPLPTITLPIEPEISILLSGDKKTIKFNVKNVDGYVNITYIFTYDSYGITRGIGPSTVKLDGPEYSSIAFDLATCSNAVCTYDENLSNTKLVINLKDKNGKNISIEKKL